MASVELLWKLSPSDIVIEDGEAHVWCVELDRPASRIDEVFRFLSEDEQRRANEFRFEEKRRHFIVGRATLRQLIGECLKANPVALEFSYTQRGKPELAGLHTEKLHFNLSHSGNLALIALTRICPLGVDLEQVRAVRYDAEIARRFFTAPESASLESLPEDEQTGAFFNLWTRKEAWLKATGVGISESLGRVEISFLPGEPACVVNVVDKPEEAKKWTLVELKPAKGFVGALAIRARGLNVRCWQWVE